MPIIQRSVIVGRSGECDVWLTDPLVSRRHFRLEYHTRGWHITDLGTANGTFVNDRRIKPLCSRRLSFGDTIAVGRAAFEWIEYDDSTEPMRLRLCLDESDDVAVTESG